MRLYLIRHGQTVLNKKGERFQGRSNSSLTKRGLSQVKLVAKKLKDRNIETLYCSPLHRARKSAEIISKAINKKPVISKALQEIGFGILEGLTRTEAFRKFPEVMREREKNKFYFAVPKGESYEIAKKRVLPFIKKLIKKHRNATIAIVAHELINKMIIGAILELKPQEILSITQPHECIYYLNSEKKTARHFLVEEKSKGRGLLKKKLKI